MPEITETKTETTNEIKATTEATTEVKPEIKKEELDLVTRVSQVKDAQEKKETDTAEGKFNINELDAEIEKITDPVVKEQMVGLKKSLLRGENQKYQEIANLRKQYETKLAEVTSWTPDRLKQELNKPDFVQAAQSVLQSGNQTGLSDDQYSALSETEKTELNQLKQKINLLEQSNWQAVKTQQDAIFKTKYANYEPRIIDDITQNLMTGKIQATREDLWKVIDYENAVRRAYELGKQDKIVENTEKVSGMTIIEGRNITTPTTVERQKGESIQNFIRRSYGEHTKKK